ncbi:MAG: hypothetical protein ONB48_12110 [candidate division KSB1 bacterium]|nr:hypothetical protein [candidate division KSB1 bacterium]MDZ7274016.1 hypothetical protein [candidate division KSB1 bacterium]MDZ7286389.1 hypothetical protein [candidate division KSB1 bacterium]MDZ7296617.1 hypothetical protein [candidate division KSB1 bacterium]MDZ7306839.1 hypothetical protein [candidate division KSB1 bacterium]
MKKLLKKLFVILTLISAGLWACKDNPAQPPVAEAPVIVAVQMPAAVYQIPRQPAGMHVRVEDPQGVADLAGVTLTVRAGNTVLATLAMADDGRRGDLLAGDGQFHHPLDSTLFQNRTGQVLLDAVATDRGGHVSETYRDTLLVLPGRENALPVITSVAIPEVIWSDSSYMPLLLATVSDDDGLATLDSVRLEIYGPAAPTPTRVLALRDDGSSGDGASRDGVFGLHLDPALFKNSRQLYTMILRAIDRAGGISPAVLRTVRTELAACRTNHAPLLSDLSAPTTISRSATPNLYLLSVRAVDPDSSCDDGIARVFFNSFRPDGTPASGNPFAMRDDGQEGDARANDRRYSLRIQIAPQNQTGTYRFEFYAQDRNGALSERLTHIINVLP